MKIVFLDIDGVLLPLPSNGELDPSPEPSKDAILCLNLLVHSSGAKVVVTSTWRHDRTVEKLNSLLRSWGYVYGVHDKTHSIKGDEDRAADIVHWIKHADESVGAFVVIDDAQQDLAILAKHLVRPKPDVGLQLHDVLAATKILNEEGAL